MPKFNKKQQYITPSGRKFGKGVWYDDNGKLIRPGQGIYDKATKTVTQYNSDGTITRLSREQWAKRKQADTEMRALQNDRRYAIPFIPEKKMTIHIDKNSPTARNRGAVISENLLDSIALNAKKAGLPFRDAIGIASQESTLGGGNRKVGQSLQPWLHTLNASPRRTEGNKISYQGVQSPSLLISNWKPYTENFFAPYAEYFYNSQLKFNPKVGDYYEDNFRGSLYRANRQAPENTSPLYQGYRSYKKAPTRYNGNDKDYPNKVRRAGDELVNHSPEIRNYMQQHNIHAYGGSLDNLRKWDELSLGEKSEIMKTALQRGITKLNEIRKAYNEYAEGGALPPSVGQYADEIYENSVEEPYGDPSPHYDNVDTALVQRLVPDARGHYDDIVKLPNHPSSPVRGTFNGNYFDLTDKGMEDPNYTLFGLIDNGDAGTVLRYNGDYVLPEITVTPDGNYYDDTYNNIRIKPRLHNFGGDMNEDMTGSAKEKGVPQDHRYNHVTTIYQSFINQGVNPQVALELTNQKVAEKGWTGWVSGDNKRYNNVDSFTDHVVDHYNRLYPDSLKSNNFNQFFQGIEGGRTKYNPYPNTYRQHLLQTRPGVKKRINMYRRSKGQSPLTLLSLPNANVMPWEDASIFNQGFMGQMQEEPEGTIAAYGGHLFKGGGSIRDQRVSQAISYFINKGLTREQAAGLVGNFMRESQMNPSALNKYSGAYGLGQWLGARKTKLFKRYGKNPTFENQLDYVWDELNSSHKRGLKMLRQSKTVDDAARNVFGYYEFSAGPEAAVAAMNRSGMGTKWKNPDGTLALNSGINYAHAAYNSKPSKVIPGLNPGKRIKIGSGLNTTLPDYGFGSSDNLLTDLPLQPPVNNSANTPDLSYVLAHNPTDYGTPTVYNIPERKQADTAFNDDYEPESNGTRILGFMNALGILDGQSSSQPLASYTPAKQNNAPFVISAPQAGNTMLDASWFKEGGYLYNAGGYTDNDVNVNAARQMLHNDIMSNPKLRNDYKDYSEEEILSAMLADKNLTTSMVANPMYQKYLTDDDIKSLPEVVVTPSQKKDANGDYYNANTSYYNSAFHPEDTADAVDFMTAGATYLVGNPVRFTQDIIDDDYKGAANEGLKALMWKSGTLGNLARFGYGAYSLANENGLPKTVNYLQNGEYGNAALSGVGDAFNALMTAYGFRGAKGDFHNFMNDTGYYQLGKVPALRNWSTGKAVSNIINDEVKFANDATNYSNGILSDIRRYVTADNQWDTKKISDEASSGVRGAVDFLASDIKKAADAHNMELAKRTGFKAFSPFDDADKRAATSIATALTYDPKATVLGSVSINEKNPANDRVVLNLASDLDKSAFHEYLHRGYYGTANGTAWDGKEDYTDWLNGFKNTKSFYDWKNSKLLAPRTPENWEAVDYLSENGEGPTNAMEIGRRMGIAPGTPWPGRKKALELFNKFASSSDDKAEVFSALNWKNKPRRIWDAITGRYILIPAVSTFSAEALINQPNK